MTNQDGSAFLFLIILFLSYRYFRGEGKLQELHDILKLLQRCKCNPSLSQNPQECKLWAAGNGKDKRHCKGEKTIEPKGETKLAGHGRYPHFGLLDFFKVLRFYVSVKHTRLCNEWYQENLHKVAFEEKGNKRKSTDLLWQIENLFFIYLPNLHTTPPASHPC